MKDPALEGVKTSIRIILLAILGFVLEAVIEKLTKTTFFWKEMLIPLLVWFDNYIYNQRKIYSSRRYEMPFWLNFKMPF